MATYTIIGGDQKAYGPITETQLRQWIVDGRADERSQVRVEGATGWKSLSELPEFRDVLPTSVPAPIAPIAPIPTHPPAAPPVARKKTSGLAVTSLVLGILGILTCGVTALVGLILGIIALVKIKNSRGALGGHGLALAGTIVSGVFLVLLPGLVILGGMLPALAAAKQKAQAIYCVDNEMQLALAVRIYSGDNGNRFPPAATWCDAINPAVGSSKVFQCPGATAGSRCDYAYNAKLDGLEASAVDPGTVMIFEADGGWNANGGPELLPGQARHSRTFVVAFADGSVRQLQENQLSTLRWDP